MKKQTRQLNYQIRTEDIGVGIYAFVIFKEISVQMVIVV